MKKPPLKERIAYRFDNLMSKGSVALIALLFLITFIVVIIVGLLAFAVDAQSTGSVGDSMWMSLMRMLDAGNLADDNLAANKFFPALMMIATICGLFVTSILIGIINTAFQTKLESLRKGNSRVLEQSHTLILGFDEHVYSIISELIVANENSRRACIVVLADAEKEYMEDSIHARIPDTKNTRVICRSGKITNFTDLENVGLLQCRSIIISSGDDLQIIKTILAAANLLEKNKNPNNIHITAIINDENNLEAARIAGGEYLEVLYFESAISRIIAQTCRQSGLSEVYQELFDFDGDEIYIEHLPQFTGKTFGEVPLYFEKSAVLGLKHKNGIEINPPHDTLLTEDDDIILIASDDGAAVPLPQIGGFDKKAMLREKREEPLQSENLLILGYNQMAARILCEIDNYIAPDSNVVIACEQEEARQELNSLTLKHLTVNVNIGDIYHRGVLEAQVEQDFDYIIVLSDLLCDTEESDAKTLMLLLHLRDIAKKGNRDFTIVSEMRDSQNQMLASCARVNDFVIGSNLVCLMMTQVSENRSLKNVFDVLLSDEGSEIYMKNALDYVQEGIEVDLFTVTKAAMQHGELAIGYKKLLEDGQYRIRVNPPKSEKIRFTQNDFIIVLAEN